ncbi:hypothetical protein RHGRI_031060 [Rhododendron griersonianum]|uniref:CS domain-containing protein n=1 Tax=Rhododendron griersonianum TaxID=479676 RepID=A0AAV6I6G2_9ERIC|nr:hypothetical protein RHGRI_031060 [Rhododendron griersonianum]
MATATLCFSSAKNPIKPSKIRPPKSSLSSYNKPNSSAITTSLSPTISLFPSSTRFGLVKRLNPFLCKSTSTVSTSTTNYEFLDGPTELELRLELSKYAINSTRDIFVDADESSLTVRVQHSGSLWTLMEATCLYDKIKPAETIWYLDDDQLVVNLKKHDPELHWPDIIESWESLSVGVMQLLKGISIYLVGDSSEINEKIAQELAVGLGYTPFTTKELLETYGQKTIDSWVIAEGSDSVVDAESVVLESLSSNLRVVVATLGGQLGAAGRADKWQHLYAGFTVWLSQSEATVIVVEYNADEDSAKEEARRNVQDGSQAYTNADVVVKLGGWDPNYAKSVAQASLSALKQLILSDKKLPGKKSLYIRLGCRGDWPYIKPPGGDPSTGGNNSRPIL